MNYILFDDHTWEQLLPLTFTRPIAEIRVGIHTIREKWESALGSKTSTLTEQYLSVKYPLVVEKNNLLINASYLPGPRLVKEIKNLQVGQGIIDEKENIIAYCASEKEIDVEHHAGDPDIDFIKCTEEVIRIERPWHIFQYNAEALADDFMRITKGRKSQKPDSSNHILSAENIFIEEGARVFNASLNASTGPIYIAKDAEVMEGSIIRGPFSLGEHSVLKLGAKIYGPTTIGPHCKVGGEINNAVFLGYANKAHDGFLGQSVIGEWCNLGADTNTSNLKNSYDIVRLWSYDHKRFIDTGLQFCGLIMGDHSKCGINTMFNTGTVVGVNANIFGPGFQRNYIPSFSWGGTHGFRPYQLEKAFQVASVVYARRNLEFNETEQNILRNVMNYAQKIR